MNKITKQKVVVYCVSDDKMLVFRHTDFSYEEVGIQVPAGSIKENEKPEEAAFRELCEETGLSNFKIIKSLGVDIYDMTPYRFEIQERHFFLAEPISKLPERWNSEELHDGEGKPTRFECFWIPLISAHVLQSGQGSMLYKISEIS